MARINRRRYSAKFKFQAVLEVLRGKRKIAEIAKSYNVHAITLGLWKKEFIENGGEVFGGGTAVKDAQKRNRDLERLIGLKEIELAFYKNFLDEGPG